MRIRKKRNAIEAVQFTGTNHAEIDKMLGQRSGGALGDTPTIVHQGREAQVGDYITATGIITKAEFDKSYEVVEDEPRSAKESKAAPESK